MQRILVFAALLLPATFAQAQTTIKITLPDTTTCTYPTGPVSSNATPGQLQATATAVGSGAGCIAGGGGVSFGPASPLAPATQTLGNVGGAAALSFQPVNAAICTASVVGPSSGVITGGATVCSSAATCSAAQSVSATFAANATQADQTNTVTVSCAGTTGAPVLSSATVIVSAHINQLCPTLTSTTSGIANFSRYSGSHNVGQPGGNARSVDVTSFNAIWGAWPGQTGLISYFTLPSNSYVSASFQSTNFFANASANALGYYQVGETDVSVPVSITISTTCGDFSNPAVFPTTSTVVPGCWGNKLVADGFVAWTKGRACGLVDGQPYFLNIINADISNLAPNGGGSAASTFSSSNSFCSGAGCVDPINAKWQN